MSDRMDRLLSLAFRRDAGPAHKAAPSARRNAAEPGIAQAARERGDVARDQRSWAEAATCYQAYLAERPTDAEIWVQLGHALKESGQLDDAESAYEAALKLKPDEADTLLHIGHLMKIEGRMLEAAEFYGRSLSLAPTAAAYSELVDLGLGARGDRILSTYADTDSRERTYIEITDLLSYLENHSAPSGIQRVQIEFIRFAFWHQNGLLARNVRFVHQRAGDDRLWLLDLRLLRMLVDHLDGHVVASANIRSMLIELQAGARLVTARPDDCFIILGAFWSGRGSTTALARMREIGAFVGVYIHDLSPINWPEHHTKELSSIFRNDLCEALQLIDFAFAISGYSASELDTFIEINGFRRIPIVPVPLAHSMRAAEGGSTPTEGDDLHRAGSIQSVIGEDFVLCVCTIEPRKNHRYLYDLWKELKKQAVPVPKLVFAGRRGWLMDDFFSQLHNSDYLSGIIVLFHDLSDREIATLYENCLFTIFPSLAEGWGLPVGESLFYGKPCVSSSATSMPEVGGDFAVYIDPRNLRSGINTVRKLLTQPDYLAQMEARIRAEFRPRTWSDVVNQFLNTAWDLRKQQSPGKRGNVDGLVRSGEVVHPRRLVRGARSSTPAAAADLKRLIFLPSFYEAEPVGAWMKGRTGSIRFRSDLPEGRPAVVFLQVFAPHPHDMSVEVRSGATVLRTSVFSTETSTLPVEHNVGENGVVELTLHVRGELMRERDSTRVFGLCLRAIGFVDRADLMGRAKVIEDLLFQ